MKIIKISLFITSIISANLFSMDSQCPPNLPTVPTLLQQIIDIQKSLETTQQTLLEQMMQLRQQQAITQQNQIILYLAMQHQSPTRIVVIPHHCYYCRVSHQEEQVSSETLSSATPKPTNLEHEKPISELTFLQIACEHQKSGSLDLARQIYQQLTLSSDPLIQAAAYHELADINQTLSSLYS